MTERERVRELLQEHGTTYAEEAGITLRDKPAPLFQLLVLTLLASTRIRAEVAADAARGLFQAGWRTPERMRRSTWLQRVEALDRTHYRRYDERTATRLDELSQLVMDRYDGDLRRLRPADRDGVPELQRALQEFSGIGPTGAGIFCREVQAVWPEVTPYFDDRALRAARRLELPTQPDALARLAPDGRVAELAAALVRVA